MTQDTSPDLDLILWGASGFTGRLVAAYLLERYGLDGELRWAIGGRSRPKLEGVLAEIAGQTGIDTGRLAIVVGDGDDESSMEDLAARTRVVCTTVGPYAQLGSKLVAACARGGTHYCDLTGELPWMRRMIDLHQKEAEASGARIVHTCGFDSIPSDIGVLFLQREMRRRHGVACRRIAYRVAKMRGGMSGGTVASLMNVLVEAGSDPGVRRVLADPYALNPEGLRDGPDTNEGMLPVWDEDFEAWTAPFIMAAINTRVVRRSNALMGQAYGADFRYDEAMLTGAGPLGFARAAGMSAAIGAGMTAGAIGPLRNLLGRVLPEPGEGPGPEEREAGLFDIRLLGEHPDDSLRNLRARVTGDRDPGYGSTAKMLGESAVCLAKDPLTGGGGFWTPASLLGEALLDRLEASAGLTFRIEES